MAKSNKTGVRIQRHTMLCYAMITPTSRQRTSACRMCLEMLRQMLPAILSALLYLVASGRL